MFTRNEFLAFVGLGAAGQKFPQEDPRKGKVAFNNQCPVCGTMAAPYLETKGSIALGATYNIIRCRRCNVAFFQDAEVQK